MDLKKLFAILLAMTIAALCLCSCGENAEETPVVSGDASVESTLPAESDDSGAETEPVEESGAVLVIDGEEIPDTENLVMFSVNGVDVYFDAYRYIMKLLDAYYFSGGDPAFYEENPDAFEALKDSTVDYLLSNYWGVLFQNEYGFELTDEDNEAIEAEIQENRDYFETEEEYLEALEASAYSEELLREFITLEKIQDRAFEELYVKDGAPLAPPEEEIREGLMNDYRHVYHVLVNFDHFADTEGYEDADEETLQQAALDYANEIAERVRNGEDMYELAQDADDPGMIDNEDGYFFTYGEMVLPFETAAFGLEVGEVSDPVASDYGYHVILRLEQENYIDEHWDEVREKYLIGVINDDINETLDSAEITYWDRYDELTYDSIK